MIVNFHKILLVKVQFCMIFLIVCFDFTLVIIFSQFQTNSNITKFSMIDLFFEILLYEKLQSIQWIILLSENIQRIRSNG